MLPPIKNTNNIKERNVFNRVSSIIRLNILSELVFYDKCSLAGIAVHGQEDIISPWRNRSRNNISLVWAPGNRRE